MDVAINPQPLVRLFSLKVEILLLLRKYGNTDIIVYPDLLARKFNRTKGAVSQSMKFLEELDLIRVYRNTKPKQQSYRKKLRLTDKGKRLVDQLLFKGLSQIEIQAIKTLNLKY